MHLPWSILPTEQYEVAVVMRMSGISDHDVSKHWMVQAELLNSMLMSEAEAECIPGV